MRRLITLISISILAVSAGAQTYTISTVAGGGLAPTPMPALSAAVWPNWVATDSKGNVYFSSTQAVYKIDASGTMTRVAGSPGGGNPLGDGGPATSAYLNEPAGIVLDAAGNLYIADAENDRVRKVTPAGIISTVAGNGTWGYTGDGGLATSATLDYPQGLAVDSAGNLYIADEYNYVIRKVTPAGIISTVAGNGSQGYTGDGGPATSATLNRPVAVAVDSKGKLYIADSLNAVARQVDTTGVISSVSFTFTYLHYSVTGVAVDSSSNLYVEQSGWVFKVASDGTISTVVNGGGGPEAAGIAVNSSGVLYFAGLDGRVYKTTSGEPTAIAGTGSFDFGDGGPATGAGLGGPKGVALDSSGNRYIADGGLVRKVTPAGTISTVAGGGSAVPGDGGPATGARLFGLCGIAVDSAGNLYIAETNSNVVRKVTPAGIISTVAGNRILGGSGDGGSATAAALAGPNGVALDSAGDLYIADLNNNRVRKVTPGGTISTVAGGSLTTASGDGGPATKAYVGYPTGVAVDAAGNLYITEQLNCRVRKVTTDGTISTVAGNGNCGYTNTDGSATGVALAYPKGVTVGIGGNVYFTAPMWIRKVTPDGIISSVAGNGNLGYAGDAGPATDATLNNPTLLAADSAGRIYIADTYNNAVRMLTPATAAPSISAGGVVPASSTVNTIQAGQWVSIYGSNLAGTTATWTGNFPTTLGGTSVTIDGKPAYLSYVSPTQINVQAPDDAATGTVQVAVMTPTGTATSTVTLARVAPAFLLLDGRHVAGLILRSNGSGAYGSGTYDIIGPTGNSLGYPTVAAKAGDVIELFATGFGPTNPTVPAGQAFAGVAWTVDPVTLKLGGVSVTPSFAGISGPGLYQFNLTIPTGLGPGDVSLAATVGGAQSQTGIVISL